MSVVNSHTRESRTARTRWNECNKLSHQQAVVQAVTDSSGELGDPDLREREPAPYCRGKPSCMRESSCTAPY